MNSRPRTVCGFTLIEMLVVMAILAIAAAFLGPAIQSLNQSGSLARASSDITSLLEQARAYAIGKNTYVYVGLQEVDSTATSASNGIGQIVVAIAASQDGTRPYTTLSGTPSLLGGSIRLIDRPHYFENVHLAKSSTLANGTNMTKRPQPSFDLGETAATTTFQWPLTGVPKNSFFKVIEFDPQGVARVQTDTVYRPTVAGYIEIPLVTMNGNSRVSASSDQAAIQVDSITGAVRLYKP